MSVVLQGLHLGGVSILLSRRNSGRKREKNQRQSTERKERGECWLSRHMLIAKSTQAHTGVGPSRSRIASMEMNGSTQEHRTDLNVGGGGIAKATVASGKVY